VRSLIYVVLSNLSYLSSFSHEELSFFRQVSYKIFLRNKIKNCETDFFIY